MKKKLTALFTASLLTIGVLTGCSGNSTTGNTDSTSANAESQTVAEAQTAAENTTAAQETTTAVVDSTAAAVVDNTTASADVTQNSSNASLITEEEAAAIALAKVSGATEDNLYMHQDTDDGISVYDGTIIYDGMEYDFEIDAQTGAIIDWESEIVNTANASSTSGSQISEAEARNIALAKVAGATEDDMYIYLDIDDGREVYSGYIIYNEMEYDFEIDAQSGTVLDWEAESIYD
ncbi:MAG: PepSY domain-containing protein [Clostridiales bacterium]|nr:PepSY domain-containing protein [Clostridiales bacterium]